MRELDLSVFMEGSVDDMDICSFNLIFKLMSKKHQPQKGENQKQKIEHVD